MKSTNGSSRKQTKRNIGARDAAIFADVIGFGLVTNSSVHSRQAPKLKPNAITKITSRLVRQGWLNDYPLFGALKYFVPGPVLIAFAGLSASRVQPLGPQSLAMNLAALEFCRCKPELSVASKSDLASEFSWLPPKLRSGKYILERDAKNVVLRLVRTDLGGDSEHVAKRCNRDISRRMQVPQFAALVRSGQVVMVVITASEVKGHAIRVSISKRTWPKGLTFQIFVFRELVNFIGFKQARNK